MRPWRVQHQTLWDSVHLLSPLLTWVWSWLGLLHEVRPLRSHRKSWSDRKLLVGPAAKQAQITVMSCTWTAKEIPVIIHLDTSYFVQHRELHRSQPWQKRYWEGQSTLTPPQACWSLVLLVYEDAEECIQDYMRSYNRHATHWVNLSSKLEWCHISEEQLYIPLVDDLSWTTAVRNLLKHDWTVLEHTFPLGTFGGQQAWRESRCGSDMGESGGRRYGCIVQL